jgi:PAS domain S-box-containing protein
VPDVGSIRRRPSGVLVVGAAEADVQSWLRGDRCTVTAAAGVGDALARRDGEPADLVIADRDPGGGLEVPEVCRALRADERFADVWLLAITPAAQRRVADQALRAGADDFVHRPFSRQELLVRARAGLRAVRQRADAGLVQTLMANVPGAIYRSAWHAGQTLELISDEIERISGYPPVNFIASRRRTLLSIIHPGDRERVLREVEGAQDDGRPFVMEYRIVRADGEVRWVLDRGQLVHGSGGRRWMDGAIFDITERRAAEEQRRRAEIEAARAEELRVSRGRIVQAADAARRKIERDLHDGAQQRLVALTLQVRMARTRVDEDPSAAGPFLDALGDELREASAELRELARGIHPAVLTERGLDAAIAALATRAPLPVEILDLPGERLPAPIEAAAYFTVAEALTNVAKYAQATHATVRAVCDDERLVVEVRDDGIGGADPGTGSGLTGLTDRLGACDGSLSVDSPAGEGTLVRAILPRRAPAAVG